MYSLRILYLYLCCSYFCLSKQLNTKYIAKNGLILRSTIECLQCNNSNKENKNYFCLKIYLRETNLCFNVTNNIILPKDSVICEKQKSEKEFCNPEDLIVEVNEFEIDCSRFAKENEENIFTDERNKDLPGLCYFEKKAMI